MKKKTFSFIFYGIAVLFLILYFIISQPERQERVGLTAKGRPPDRPGRKKPDAGSDTDAVGLPSAAENERRADQKRCRRGEGI